MFRGILDVRRAIQRLVTVEEDKTKVYTRVNRPTCHASTLSGGSRIYLPLESSICRNAAKIAGFETKLCSSVGGSRIQTVRTPHPSRIPAIFVRLFGRPPRIRVPLPNSFSKPDLSSRVLFHFRRSALDQISRKFRRCFKGLRKRLYSKTSSFSDSSESPRSLKYIMPSLIQNRIENPCLLPKDPSLHTSPYLAVQQSNINLSHRTRCTFSGSLLISRRKSRLTAE